MKQRIRFLVGHRYKTRDGRIVHINEVDRAQDLSGDPRPVSGVFVDDPRHNGSWKRSGLHDPAPRKRSPLDLVEHLGPHIPSDTSPSSPNTFTSRLREIRTSYPRKTK